MSLATETEAPGAAIDRMFGALAAGDLDAALAACTPDAVFWHSYDQLPMTLDDITPAWRDLIANFPERAFVDVRREPTPGGFAQRHLMVVRMADGARRAWPIAIFVTLRDGRVARLDEYIDRGGSYVLADDDTLTTPGLPPRA